MGKAAKAQAPKETPSAKLAPALRKAAKAKLPAVAKLRKEDAAAIDARADLGLRVIRQMDAVLALLRTRPGEAGIEGRLERARVSRPVGAREIAATDASALDASVALWGRLAGISAYAWRDLLAAEEAAKRTEGVAPDKQAAEDDEFRRLYMGILTDGLASELDQLREDEQLGEASVDMLVNALETGASTFLPFERALVLHSFAEQ
ncbi:hypothetical protein T492DRAFT_1071672 [Pavlovales sp. CCMP2436]|nr:hypothetical protein T492DRAFT_1071672 [Pavlovales sp. CCMP2436]